jgi:hypothetical protein
MAEEDRVEQLVNEARGFIGMRAAPDLTGAVMHHIDDLRIEGASPSRGSRTRWVRALWTPRRVAFEFRPAYGLVAAAALVVLAVSVPQLWRSSLEQAIAARANAGSQTVLVQFHLQAPDATDVRLAGSFTGWRPEYELHQTAPGFWTITVPLSPGVHDYAFVIDGRQWVTDPFATAVRDGFGGTNSRITLLASDRRL